MRMAELQIAEIRTYIMDYHKKFLQKSEPFQASQDGIDRSIYIDPAARYSSGSNDKIINP